MNPRLLMALGFGLSLVACDKPAGPDGTAGLEPGTERQLPVRPPARNSPPTLRQRLESALKTVDDRDKALAAVAWDAIETDPETAHKAFHEIAADSPEKILLIQHYAMRLAAENPTDAIAWATSLGSETETSAAVGHVAIALAETDPLRAANLLSEFGIANRDFEVALVQVVQRWAATSPPEAVSWVVTFPEGEARQASLQTILKSWLPEHPSAVFEWFGSLHEPTLRTEAVESINATINQLPEAIQQEWQQQLHSP